MPLIALALLSHTDTHTSLVQRLWFCEVENVEFDFLIVKMLWEVK